MKTPAKISVSAAPSCAHADETSPSSTDRALPELDEAVIGKWRSFLPPEKFDELVSSQLEGAKSQAQRLHDAGQSGNLEELGRAAHDVKGVCGNLGMARVADLADSLRQACLSGEEKDAFDLLESVGHAVQAATTVFEDHFLKRQESAT